VTVERGERDRFLDAHWGAPGEMLLSAGSLHTPEGADPAHLCAAGRRVRALGEDARKMGLGPVSGLSASLADLADRLAEGAVDPLGPAGVVLEDGARALEEALLALEAGGEPDAARLAAHVERAVHAAAVAAPRPAPVEAAGAASEHWGPWSPPYPEMADEFLEEVQGHIDALQAGLIKLSRGEGSADLVNALFRSSHSIKGQSGQMAAQPLERVAHKLEDVLDLVRQGKLAISPETAETLLGVIDSLQSMLGQIRVARSVDHPVGREIATLEAIVRGEPPRPARPAAPAPAAPSAPAPAAPASRPAREDRPAPAQAPRAEEQRIQYLRVDFAKVDRVMNLVGDLFINKIKLHDAVGALDALQVESLRLQHLLARTGDGPTDGLELGEDEARALVSGIGKISAQLEVLVDRLTVATGETDMISGDLRDQVMVMRMVPLDAILGRLGRVLFDAVQKENRGNAGHKQARLEVAGSDAEIDKVIAGMIEVPLVHIVRNSVGHGIEPAAERTAAGKAAEGLVRIQAGQKGGNFVIEITDDGRGIEPGLVARTALQRGIASEDEIAHMSEKEVLSLIFRPGFTTAEKADDLKGRGVGLDEVSSKIGALKGSIDVQSTVGKGTRVTLTLPLTLAINTVLVGEVAGETLAIPMAAVEKVVRVAESQVERMGQAEVFTLLGQTVTLVRADEMLGIDRPRSRRPDECYVPILVVGDRRFGLAMDMMSGKQDVVVKSLGTLLGEVPLVAGATLLGEKCILILDPVDIAARVGRSAARPGAPVRDRVRPRLLLVDDDFNARIALRRIFEEAGLDVVEAADGAEALSLATASRFQLVSTDVVMPRMDGYELTRRLRALPDYREAPIIMISSKGEEPDRRAGFDAGVDHYVVKPVDRSRLLELIDEVRL